MSILYEFCHHPVIVVVDWSIALQSLSSFALFDMFEHCNLRLIDCTAPTVHPRCIWIFFASIKFLLQKKTPNLYLLFCYI